MTNRPVAPVEAVELEAHCSHLFKFAMLELRNEARAEDVVQETLLAAIQGAERFTGSSSVRTWLIGILKHKIVDQFRKGSREGPLDPSDNEASHDEVDAQFNQAGRYVETPANWGNPEAALSQHRFFEVLWKSAWWDCRRIPRGRS